MTPLKMSKEGMKNEPTVGKDVNGKAGALAKLQALRRHVPQGPPLPPAHPPPASEAVTSSKLFTKAEHFPDGAGAREFQVTSLLASRKECVHGRSQRACESERGGRRKEACIRAGKGG